MGNQCCDKQNKNTQIDKLNTKVFDQNDKQIPPNTLPSAQKNTLHRITNQSITSNKISNNSLHCDRNGHYASITPPSHCGQHPHEVWNMLQTNSIPPTDFFASNLGWKQRSSNSNQTAIRSSVRFTYNSNINKNILDQINQNPQQHKKSKFASENTKIKHNNDKNEKGDITI